MRSIAFSLGIIYKFNKSYEKIILINLIILLSLSKIYSQDKTFYLQNLSKLLLLFLGENNNKFNYGFHYNFLKISINLKLVLVPFMQLNITGINHLKNITSVNIY